MFAKDWLKFNEGLEKVTQEAFNDKETVSEIMRHFANSLKEQRMSDNINEDGIPGIKLTEGITEGDVENRISYRKKQREQLLEDLHAAGIKLAENQLFLGQLYGNHYDILEEKKEISKKLGKQLEKKKKNRSNKKIRRLAGLLNTCLWCESNTTEGIEEAKQAVKDAEQAILKIVTELTDHNPINWWPKATVTINPTMSINGVDLLADSNKKEEDDDIE